MCIVGPEILRQCSVKKTREKHNRGNHVILMRYSKRVCPYMRSVLVRQGGIHGKAGIINKGGCVNLRV